MQKLRRRQNALSSLDLTEEQTRVIEEALTVDFTSSEEEGENTVDRFTRPLTWESAALTSWKQQLDKQHYETTTDIQKKKMLRTKRGEPSMRECPSYAPRWTYQ